MKNLYKLLTVIGVSLFVTSCYYDAYIEIPDDGGDVIIPEEVSFMNDVEPLFGRCAGCHNATLDPDLRAGNAYNSLVPAYVTVGDGENSLLYNNLPGVGHPQDVGFIMNANQISTIKAWIDQGAKNN